MINACSTKNNDDYSIWEVTGGEVATIVAMVAIILPTALLVFSSSYGSAPKFALTILMVGFLCLPYAFVKLLHSKQLHVTPIIVALVMAVISFSGLMHEVSGMSDAIPSECTKIGADEQPTKMLDGKCYQIRYGLWEDISYRVSKSGMIQLAHYKTLQDELNKQ